MGSKIVFTYAFLAFFTVNLQVISAFLRWHSVRFMSFAITVFRMETGLWRMKVDTGSSLLCRYRAPGHPSVKPGLCQDLGEGMDLQTVQQQWCAPAITQFMPGPCRGFIAAYYSGAGMIFIMITNWILLSVSVYLLFLYMGGSHKAQYRYSAQLMCMIGTMLLGTGIVFYGVFTMKHLDGIGGSSLGSVVVANRGSGVSYGYILMCVAMVFQIVCNLLFFCMAKGDELSYEEHQDAKARAEIERLRYEAEAQSRPLGGNAFNPVYGSGGYGSAMLAPGLAPQPVLPGQGVAPLQNIGAMPPMPQQDAFGLPPPGQPQFGGPAY